jgi:hypothetical protein
MNGKRHGPALARATLDGLSLRGWSSSNLHLNEHLIQTFMRAIQIVEDPHGSSDPR